MPIERLDAAADAGAHRGWWTAGSRAARLRCRRTCAISRRQDARCSTAGRRRSPGVDVLRARRGGRTASRGRGARLASRAPPRLCTTHEALEPWRFDFTEAALMQVQGARLAAEAPRLSVMWHGARRYALGGRLGRPARPAAADQRTIVSDAGRRSRAPDHAARSGQRRNLVCLSMPSPGSASAGAWRGSGVNGSEAAVFVARPEQAPFLVWARLSESPPGVGIGSPRRFRRGRWGLRCLLERAGRDARVRPRPAPAPRPRARRRDPGSGEPVAVGETRSKRRAVGFCVASEPNRLLDRPSSKW